MFWNNVKTAFRNIIRYRVYSIINLAGLAIGLACFILISLWIYDELSYDRFHKNAERLFLIAQTRELATGTQTLSTQCSPLAPIVKEEIPGIVDYTRYCQYPYTLASQDKVFSEHITFADSSLFNMFSFSCIHGNLSQALNDPHSIVLTRSKAEKYFGDIDPVGKSLQFEGRIDMKVTAIIEDIPDNSSLQMGIIIPLGFMNEIGYNLEEWAGADYYTFLLLEDKADYPQTSAAIGNLCCDIYRQQTGQEECPYNVFLHPLTKYHLYSLSGSGGRIQYVWIMGAVALFIIAIACLNFINITTARSTSRAKEIGMRKVIGADRLKLIKQILGESYVMTAMALIMAMILVEIFLPLFNQLAAKKLHMDFSHPGLLLSLLVVLIITGLFAGIYPAFYLSRFKPVEILKSKIKSDKAGLKFRRVLVVFQFSLSLILIICTVVIHGQLGYIQNKDLGLNKENAIYFRPSAAIQENYSAFKSELLKSPDILDVGASMQGITHINSTIGQNFDYEGKPADLSLELHFDWVNYDYAKTLGIEMAEGRFYSPDFASDANDGIVLNETAVKLMGIENPIGKRFSYWGNEKHIIGVVRDFYLEPLYETLKPMILIYNQTAAVLYVRLGPENTPGALAYIEKVYKDFEPSGTFGYRFLEDAYKLEYRGDQRLSRILTCFSGLAIFVACLGLFGLVAFIAEQSTKEIGIRKVLGASVGNIVARLSREFLILVLIANLVAWPLAYFLMRRFLEHYAYHVGINLWTFLACTVLVLMIALLTVSFRALRAASMNPVESLRHE
jgi:putative ABC transport system permease protein